MLLCRPDLCLVDIALSGNEQTMRHPNNDSRVSEESENRTDTDMHNGVTF